jgi:uncharacterized protein (DUF2235 family)
MTKKLIVCCDGTNNEIKENQSNVLKFYRLIKKDWTDKELLAIDKDVLSTLEPQLAFYDAGVGTISNSSGWSRLKSKSKSVFGLATGLGLDQNVLDAYRFLVLNYVKGDKICLFGFSRGAYTARVLAGFIHMIGLMKPEQVHLANYALTAYKQANDDNDDSIAYRFNEVLDTYRPSIEFMGCWDTVGSVIVPRADRMYLPSLEELPHVNDNTSVKCFRHAMAIDEQRTMFKVSLWKEGQIYKFLPFLSDEQGGKQDVKQTWFAGVHSDIGGGYREEDSGLAKITLKWMVDEARESGIQFRETMVKRLVEGKNPAKATRTYCEPDPLAKMHNSMGPAWKVIEFIPKFGRRSGADKKTWHLPRSERRYISEHSNIHESVKVRQDNLDYDPSNLK